MNTICTKEGVLMKKFLIVPMLCFLLVSCNKDKSSDGTEVTIPGGDTENLTPAPTPVPTPAPTPENPTSNNGLPNEAFTFDSNIVFIQTTSEQQAKFDKAVEIIKKVVATEEFRSKVLNHTYNGEKTFVDNGGYTNEQIYQKVLEAAEKLFPTKNNAMDMEVELYYAATTTVGYTYSSSKRIWVNTKYFDTFAPTSVASNLFHEWLHKVGFGHAATYSVSRDYSVPYAVGRMIRSIGTQYL